MTAGHAVADWMVRHRRSRLVVLSPHLDDAVYSACSILSTTVHREVVTVVTEGRAGVSTAWSSLTGFPDSATEHRARRAEDEAVLRELGVAPRHLGACTDDRKGIFESIRIYMAGLEPEIDRIAWLLPAGAGRQHSRAARLFARVSRRPLEDGPHPEHVQVRDAATRTLARQPAALWGYYAELPYAWQQSLAGIERRLPWPDQARPGFFSADPDPAAKRVAAAGYLSQATVALGADTDAQTRFCSRQEVFLLG